MIVLLVEDEARVADFIRRGLRSEGWTTEHVGSGEEALETAVDEYDVIVLDIMLPGISGIEVCQKLRARKCVTPILMLSALDAVDERVAGLNCGADDYLPKPFTFDELIARLNALVRRRKAFDRSEDAHLLALGPVTLDTQSQIVTVEGDEIDLTLREREVLAMMLANSGKALARERILNAVWGGQQDPLTNVVDVHVGRLRKKLGPAGDMIKTVRGIGYRFGR